MATPGEEQLGGQEDVVEGNRAVVVDQHGAAAEGDVLQARDLLVEKEIKCCVLGPNMSFLCCPKTLKNVVFMLSKNPINMLFKVSKCVFSKA